MFKNPATDDQKTKNPPWWHENVLQLIQKIKENLGLKAPVNSSIHESRLIFFSVLLKHLHLYSLQECVQAHCVSCRKNLASVVACVGCCPLY